MNKKPNQLAESTFEDVDLKASVLATPKGLRDCLCQLALEAEQAGYSYLANLIREAAHCATDIVASRRNPTSQAIDGARRVTSAASIVTTHPRSTRKH